MSIKTINSNSLLSYYIQKMHALYAMSNFGRDKIHFFFFFFLILLLLILV